MSSNFRHQLLSLSLLVGIAAPWAAFAQAPISSVGSGSVEDRVTQLERISNAHSQLLTQLQQQLTDNQSDIDSLRGQIQENQYQLNQSWSGKSRSCCRSTASAAVVQRAINQR
ncbi:putative tetratricopeptide repeat exported protein [Escherichia coli]|nr:putative tetratricopeptide repeat exported protein [Escherichia coli]